VGRQANGKANADIVPVEELAIWKQRPAKSFITCGASTGGRIMEKR